MAPRAPAKQHRGSVSPAIVDGVLEMATHAEELTSHRHNDSLMAAAALHYELLPVGCSWRGQDGRGSQPRLKYRSITL
jgi:hypothetical protein